MTESDNKPKALLVFLAILLVFSLGFWGIPKLIDLLIMLRTYTPSIESLSYNPHPSPDDIFDAQGVPMRAVPAGEFTMGSKGYQRDEEPIHTVWLNAFTIDKYEVTNARYAACVIAGKCQAPKKKTSATRSNYYSAEFANYPVIYVDWNMAKTYCAWRRARLPSESEWEKAARGTDERTYPWGEKIDITHANYDKDDTTAVGSYESGQSPYGVYDMAGNVWEWTADLYDMYPGGDPSNSDRQESFGKYYVVRGGSQHEYLNDQRVSDRVAFPPNLNADNGGIRCVR